MMDLENYAYEINGEYREWDDVLAEIEETILGDQEIFDDYALDDILQADYETFEEYAETIVEGIKKYLDAYGTVDLPNGSTIVQYDFEAYDLDPDNDYHWNEMERQAEERRED